ncbi:MAG: mechanosensitive ion channel family protein [Proteobacteria bacterium]|nr:mechanosensitive ion channel family protein [Pseudomonadota bacterium]
MNQIVGALIVGVVGGLVIFALEKLLWPYFEKRRGKPVAYSLANFIHIVISIFCVIFIVVGIFNQSILNFLAFGTFLGAGVGFAMQGPILDWFSGIIVDFDSSFNYGEWIEIDGQCGKIIKQNWRCITISTVDNTLISIPNSDFLKKQYKNLTKEGGSWDSLEITMDHTIPVERVESLFKGALYQLKTDYSDYNIFASKVTEGGIVYECRFKMSNPSLKRTIKHDMIKYITTELHKYDLGVSETFGEYILSKRQKTNWDINPTTILFALKNCSFFNYFSDVELESLSYSCDLIKYDANSKIVNIGDTSKDMYIVAEGLLNVMIKDKENNDISVARLAHGNYFGEMALFLKQPRQATIQTLSPCLLVKISEDTMLEQLKKHPEMVDHIIFNIQRTLESNASLLKQLDIHEENIIDVLKNKLKKFFHF